MSIDSLQRDRFYELTRRDALDRVLRGLEVLSGFPEAHPIKVNAVAIRGFTEQEVLPFAELARRTPYEVRFIEFMPLDADRAWRPEQVLTGAEIRAAISRPCIRSSPLERPDEHATARVYRFADGQGRIGFINPVSEPFCSDCNRIRLTADGRLRTCLFSLRETDLRAPDARRRRPTPSSSRSSATRCGARSSSTTWASRGSCSRRGRCRPSAADQSAGADWLRRFRRGGVHGAAARRTGRASLTRVERNLRAVVGAFDTAMRVKGPKRSHRRGAEVSRDPPRSSHGESSNPIGLAADGVSPQPIGVNPFASQTRNDL